MLAAIDQQKRIGIDRGRFDPIRSQAKCRCDLHFDPIRIRRCELHEPYAVRVAIESTVAELESGACLAGPAHPVHGHQAGFVEQLIELVQGLGATYEGADLARKVALGRPRGRGACLSPVACSCGLEPARQVCEEVIGAFNRDEVALSSGHDPRGASLRGATSSPVGRVARGCASLERVDECRVPFARPARDDEPEVREDAIEK